MDKKPKGKSKVNIKDKNKSKKRKLIEKSPEFEQNFLEQEPDLLHMKKDISNKIDRKKKSNKLLDKKNEKERQDKGDVDKADQLSYEDEDHSDKQKKGRVQDSSHAIGRNQSKTQIDKPKKTAKKKDNLSSNKGEKLVEKSDNAEPDEVYHITSVDEDSSKGMKRWVLEYHESRPGLKILQQGIDEFITSYEAQEEQARKEREARAAEGGWTVVVHHKGRKKTIDSESGITVGSVAQAAVVDKMAKKKSKEVGLDFYRFQRREAQRNEIMMLQSKFEQDRKRIQQLRAARKFRPY
ncbi:PREDICTED: myb-like protein X [Nelumbo nucifera]|uniref:Myb-like protein X n=2 Tax=Nelumbo nucifera TaxID=4432 RepID=A0A1U7YU68_NELNU|nr:PREDICTED: myb-like protein X [Nelumbo nucifera]DAD25212.1 TPA_asm: hypothetical protein HUJ06_026676 [Nelumbo nucifera]